ncbi:hypothetical protein SLEP1_g22544 [Rubroshorea leprosula]|uniref:DUF4218 domain-containing protein n=1 Tax=Rubroshorea leprosula TaxID=152421 RepID=A0AAV5JFL2_9ROSI|nr:hypothetical protein SLEP1_g22544 [Rubroshorea leprosula]
MHGLKSLVKNKARPEGPICENYIMSEISYFISLYFKGEVETRGDRIPKNLVGLGPSVNNGLSIFNNLGKPIGSLQQQRVLTMEECNAAMYYVIMNCEELKGWIEVFEEEECQNMTPQQTHMKCSKYLVSWFQKSVLHDEFNGIDEHLICLAHGLSWMVSCYKSFWVNGFRFHTASYGRNKRKMNSSVCITGTTGTESDLDFYGLLQEVIELQYVGSRHRQTVVLFKCDCQAKQVYYTPYPSHNSNRKGWLAALKCRARSIIEMPDEQEDQHDETEPIFQDDDPLPPQPTETDLILYQPIQHTNGTASAINVEFESMNDDKEYQEEDEEEEDEFEDYSTSEEDNIEYISESDSSD